MSLKLAEVMGLMFRYTMIERGTRQALILFLMLLLWCLLAHHSWPRPNLPQVPGVSRLHHRLNQQPHHQLHHRLHHQLHP